jgi:hypothetical protein
VCRDNRKQKKKSVRTEDIKRDSERNGTSTAAATPRHGIGGISS